MANRITRLHRSPLSVALIAALALPAGAAFAQTTTTTTTTDPSAPAAATAAPTGTAKKLEKVTVTGSNIQRAEIEGPAPVVVITREEMEREGYQTVGDMLQQLPQNTTSSFTGDIAVTTFTPNAQVANLRNLGPGYTLTLINGRRPAQYPQPYNRDNNVVNIRAIPTAMIERVEVLTGGASAIYGSDAVAGVVNIVTRTNYDGHYLKGTVGTTDDGGGDSWRLEYSGGKTGDRWSATWAFQTGETDPVFASQREQLESSLAGPRGYIPGVTNPALSMIAIRASGANLNQNAFYPGAAACDAFGYTTVTTAARGTYCGSFDQPASRSIQNQSEFYSAYGYGTFDLTDNVELFGSATFYDSNAKASAGTEFWGTSGDQFMVSSTGAARSSYFDPQFGANIQLQRVFNAFELGGPEAASTLYDEKTWELMVGARGTFSNDWDWEATLSNARYFYTQDRPRLLAKAVHDYFLDPCTTTSLASCGPNATQGFTGGVPIYRLDQTLWSTPITPDIYKGFATRVINEGVTGSSNANFIVRGDLFDFPAGTVGFAAGMEIGRQTTDLVSDPRTNPLRPRDEQTVYNLVSSGETHGERDRYAAFAEMRIPILDTFTAQLAGRYDKYEDISEVDDAFTWNLGLEWRPLSSLLLRGSYATSFRAPDMQFIYSEGAASFSGILDEYACRSGTGIGLPTPPAPRSYTQCNVSGDRTIYTSQTLIAGNPGLKEEEGKSFSAGFVWDIAEGMDVSVDYWRIKLEDQASQLSAATLLRQEADCRLGVQRDGTPSNFALDSAFCQNVLGLITRLPPEPGTINDQRVSAIRSAYINVALTDLSGIDTTYRYNWQMGGLGHFYFDFAHALLLTNRYKQFESDPLIDYRDNPFVNDQRSRVKTSLAWVTPSGDWRTTVTGVRYGTAGNVTGVEYVDPITGAHEGKRLPAWFQWNLSISKKWGEHIDSQFTINNLANAQYRQDNSNLAYPFFDPYIGSDPLGRRFYLSVGYKF